MVFQSKDSSSSSEFSGTQSMQSSINTTKVSVLPEYDLNEEEWSELLKSCKLQKFNNNEIICDKEKKDRRIFQVARGSCKILESSGSVRVLSNLAEGSIFNEYCYLQNVENFATICADGNNVEIYIFEPYTLDILFAVKPILAAKFFRFLANTLSKRFEEYESSQTIITSTN